MAQTTHTIVGTERAWAGRVKVAFVLCTLAASVLTALAWPLSPIGWVLALISVALLAIDLMFLMHGETSVGMIPIALIAILPAALAAYTATGAVPALVSMVVCGLLACFMLVWFVRMAAATRSGTDTASANAAIVLGCAVRQGRPSTTLQLRLDAAVELGRRHPELRIIVTGGVSSPNEPSEAQVMAAVLADAGIPAERIIVEDRALNTEENLARSRGIMESMGFGDSAWLITSDYHMWRARTIARDVGLSTIPYAAPTPVSSWLVQWCREVLVICFGA